MRKETNRLAVTIGFWSSLLGMLTFVIFSVSFVGIAVSGPVVEWTTLDNYVATTRQHSQALKHLAQLCMLAFAPLFVVLLNSIHEYAADDKKILTRIGLSFAIAAMVLIGAMYFVQLSTVRLSIQNDQLDGIEHFMEFYPNSAMLSIGMLGWTLFLGLSTLFVAPVFSGTRWNTVIKGALFATSAACLLGGVGFVLDSFWLVFLTINFGMGAALIVSMLALTVFFYRLGRTPSDPAMA